MSCQEVCKKVHGVLKIVDQFDYLFALLLGDQLLWSVGILKRTRQSVSLNTVEVAHLRRIYSDEEAFEAFWMRAQSPVTELDTRT